ncbi:MAG: hypothetical protein PHN38_09980 [Sulfurospirillaceae bacterium]|nr:hypothetical protein [Sulfurospirillaceae bacterium]MDD3463322.1 hypothetical protein [Sulfurospirillaceae bacterium]
MRTSYKPLVERFNIPRATLIEWQKKSLSEKNNWRVKHLEYLRVQLIVDEETAEEVRAKAVLNEDLFVMCIYVFFYNIDTYVSKNEFKKGLREFALTPISGVEYQHDFAKKVWSLSLDGSSRKIVDYFRVFDVLERLTSAQYALVLNMVISFVDDVKHKLKIDKCKSLLDGKTWQELYAYDKAFSAKNIDEYFKKA